MKNLPKVYPDSFRDVPALYAQVLKHGLVVVKEWQGGETEFVNLGRSFGVLERPSRAMDQHRGQLFRVTSEGTENVNVGRYWHSDGFAHTAAPALITLYHVTTGVKASEGTAFVDGNAAWNSLDKAWQHRLEGRYWTHVCGSRHPIVLNHYALNMPVLSINLGKLFAIDGMNALDAKATATHLGDALDRMSGHLHAWEEGDVLIVDNRKLLHRAPLNVIGERILWRLSVIKLNFAVRGGGTW